MPRPFYADLADLPEDQRIEIMIRCVTTQGKTIACALDNDAKKIARYKNKLNAQAPGLLTIEQLRGLTPGTVFLKISPKPGGTSRN